MPVAPSRRLAIAADATLVVAVLAGAGSSPASAAVKKPPSAATALRSLVSQTVALPRSSVATARRASLLRLARRARRTATSAPCGSVRDLTS